MSKRRRTLNKAADAISVAGVTFTADQVAALVASGQGRAVAPMTPMPRMESNVPFGPGVPLTPAPINPPRPDTGRPEPRAYEYPASVNVSGFGDKAIPWSTLRSAADGISIFRKCIEIRKDEVATLEWDIVISDRAIERALKSSGSTPRAELQQAMQAKLEPEIARMIDFWEEPDRRNGLDWIGWAKKAIEERLVLDALAIYPRRTFGGDVYSLEILDGSTIKPLLDEYGGRPMRGPAYQQILYGFPRGDFTAEIDSEGALVGGYPADQLIYEVDNVRSMTPYGYSAVERALQDGLLYMQRNAWMLAEYTDGVMPSGWLLAGAGQADWTPSQLAEYERLLNDYYAGITAARQRLRILPYGMIPHESVNMAEKYKPDYDLHLIKLSAGHFATTISELGFTETGGLGSTGWHEGQADVQDRKATQPTLRALESLVTKISRKQLGMPKELRFRILGLESEDENAADEVAHRRTQSARMTLNDDRDRLGLARYGFKEADMPFIVTQGGIVFVEGSSQAVTPPAQVADDGPPTQQPVAAPQQPGQGGEPGKSEPTDVQKAEAAALRRWVRKNPHPSRPFRVEHLTKSDVAELGVPAAHVLFKADDGGDAGPKAPKPDRRWPAWRVDEALAAAYAAEIQTALAAGLTTSAALALADAWLAAATTGVTDAAAWLRTRGITTEPLTSVLTDLYTEAYFVGERSAAATLHHGAARLAVEITTDWGSWKPGDVDSARTLLSADGRDIGLIRLLHDARIVIKSIAEHRLDELAAVLADGLERGLSPEEIGRAIRGLVNDPAKAYQIAVTETARAISASSLDEYHIAGIGSKGWMTALDQDVCPLCAANEAAGDIPLDDEFPSGDQHPPGHPRCRCAIIPGFETGPVEKIERARLAKRFNASQPRDEHGRWADGLGLGRKLGDALRGSLVSSHRMRGNSGSNGSAVFALFDTPRGRRLRFGIVASGDERSWKARKHGGTLELNEHQAAELADKLDRLHVAGDEFGARVRDIDARLNAAEADHARLSKIKNPTPEQEDAIDEAEEQAARLFREWVAAGPDSTVATESFRAGGDESLDIEVAGNDNPRDPWQMRITVHAGAGREDVSPDLDLSPAGVAKLAAALRAAFATDD